MTQINQPSRVGEFRYEFFDCCDSLTDCLLAYLCPHCYAFIAAREAGKGMCGSLCQCIFYPICLCCMRADVRDDRGIEGGCCVDILATQCCPCCAVIQIKREYHE